MLPIIIGTKKKSALTSFPPIIRALSNLADAIDKSMPTNKKTFTRDIIICIYFVDDRIGVGRCYSTKIMSYWPFVANNNDNNPIKIKQDLYLCPRK